MLIGVFSDIHDNLANLDRALAMYQARGITRAIFCGDFCSPIPARAMGKFPGVIDCVFGNGDGDRFTMARVAATDSTNLTLHGEHAELEVAGRRIGVTHYPLYGRMMARSGDYDAVFSGHTHVVSQERFGDALWVNPGEIMGWKGPATCAIYDAELHEVEIVTVSGER